MTISRLLKETERFARPYCEQQYLLWHHVQLVRQYALKLAIIEEIDPQVVEMAAILHDIGKDNGRENHHVRSHELSKEFLKQVTLPEVTKELILQCVLNHGSGSPRDRLEVRVVRSADVLGTLFDDEWQEHSRKTMSKETLIVLYEKALNKIDLDSARRIAEPQIIRLKALLK